MGAGYIAYDGIFFLLATVLYGSALSVAFRAHAALSAWLPSPFAIFPAFFVGLAALLVEVSILSRLCPRLKPGRYPLLKGTIFYGWVVRSALRRILYAPGLQYFLFASNTLRYLSLRGLGARVAFTTSMSSDAEILDPSLLVAGPGATFGARSFVSGHYIEGDNLILGQVTIGKNTLLGADVMCAPSVEIGDNVSVRFRASISIGSRIGDGARIGADSYIDSNVVVAPGAIVPNRSFIPARSEVTAEAKPDGG